MSGGINGGVNISASPVHAAYRHRSGSAKGNVAWRLSQPGISAGAM